MCKKGNPRAIDPAERQDRWQIDAAPNPLPADADHIREILDVLASFRADGPDRVGHASTWAAVDTVVTITARESARHHHSAGLADGGDRCAMPKAIRLARRDRPESVIYCTCFMAWEYGVGHRTVRRRAASIGDRTLRKARIERKTKETEILAEVNLDGDGRLFYIHRRWLLIICWSSSRAIRASIFR